LMSTAMQHRLITCTVGKFPRQEKIDILNKIYDVPLVLAREIVRDFEWADKDRQPPLTFRDLITKYDQAIPHIIMTASQRRYDHHEMLNLFTALQQWYNLGEFSGQEPMMVENPAIFSNDHKRKELDDDSDHEYGLKVVKKQK